MVDKSRRRSYLPGSGGRIIIHSTASSIVRYLRSSGGFVSGEEIAARMGVTRAAIWKQVSSLREKGFLITSVTNRGYRLDSVPDVPSEEVLSALLNTVSFGKNIEYHSVIGSTNVRAMSLGHTGAPEGTVVTADRQTEGKARLGGSWSSPPGKNLYMSLLLKPETGADRIFELERIFLTAMRETLAAACPELSLEALETGLFCDGRKVGGVLFEVCGEIGRVHHAVAGTGLNVTHGSRLSDTASILELTGQTLSRAELTASMLEKAEKAYRKWKSNEQV